MDQRKAVGPGPVFESGGQSAESPAQASVFDAVVGALPPPPEGSEFGQERTTLPNGIAALSTSSYPPPAAEPARPPEYVGPSQPPSAAKPVKEVRSIELAPGLENISLARGAVTIPSIRVAVQRGPDGTPRIVMPDEAPSAATPGTGLPIPRAADAATSSAPPSSVAREAEAAERRKRGGGAMALVAFSMIAGIGIGYVVLSRGEAGSSARRTAAQPVNERSIALADTAAARAEAPAPAETATANASAAAAEAANAPPAVIEAPHAEPEPAAAAPSAAEPIARVAASDGAAEKGGNSALRVARAGDGSKSATPKNIPRAKTTTAASPAGATHGVKPAGTPDIDTPFLTP